jgi:hypothetical protein
VEAGGGNDACHSLVVTLKGEPLAQALLPQLIVGIAVTLLELLGPAHRRCAARYSRQTGSSALQPGFPDSMRDTARG